MGSIVCHTCRRGFNRLVEKHIMSEEVRQLAIAHAERAVNNLMKQTQASDVDHPMTIKQRQQQLESLAMWHMMLAALRAYNG